MKKKHISFICVLLSLVIILQVFQNIDIFKVSKAAEKVLGPGQYLYLQPAWDGDTWAKNDPLIIMYYYNNTVGGHTNIKMEKYDDMYRVKLPNDMDGSKVIVFRRINPAYTLPSNPHGWLEVGDYAWNQSVDVYLSGASNSNVYKITSWSGGTEGKSSGQWLGGNWITSSYAGETVYFVDMDKTVSTSVDCEFLVSSTSSTERVSMSLVEGTSNVWSVVIPSNAEYDKAIFYNESNESLATVQIIDGDYMPQTNNTYYYKRTILADGTEISGFDEFIPQEESIAGKKLYLDKFSFMPGIIEAPTIQIGDGEPVTFSVDGNDSGIYSYTIPSQSTATTRTLITLINEENEYHFYLDDLSKDTINIVEDIAMLSGTYQSTSGKAVYFDATLSKLVYGGGQGDYGMPNSSGKLYYYATGGSTQSGEMEKVPSFTVGKNTYSDVYVAYIPSNCTNIVFSSYVMSSSTNYAWCGDSTNTLTIPTNLNNPCFYADTSDYYIYNNNSSNQRGGIWAEVGRIIDPQDKAPDKMSSETNPQVVTVPEEAEVRDTNKLYLNTTFYDFYSDSELNGFNRKYYEGSGNNHRIYQPFRQFNQALSSYYEKVNASSPLYWGNFQNYGSAWSGSSHYSEISENLNLYGSDNTKKFFYENNSMWDINGNELGSPAGQYATQGLISDTLVNGNLMIETNGSVVKAPYFDKDFLRGNNSKNAMLGNVYEDVVFPFNKTSLTSKSDTSIAGEVDYWYFDSKEADNNLRLHKDTVTGEYFLKSSSSVVNRATTDGVTSNGNFFPFNSSNQSGNSYKLNYGFATKIEFKFRLTENGKVINNQGNETPIEFNFSGDDDIWIFIDGKLALDIGGDHGVVTGYLDFSNRNAGNSKEKIWKIDRIKNPSGGGYLTDDAYTKGTFEIKGDNTDEHTLTLFYMERGLWESNMYMSFNFPDANSIEVEKEVDDSTVNQELFAGLFDDYSFDFDIRNYATHYAPLAVENASQVLTGFITKQYQISDYGSIAAQGLVFPVGAKFDKYDKNDNKTTGTIGINGDFSLKGKESILFTDQFRRGSYISIREKENPLFTTTWTMYENEKAVTSMKDGDTVNLEAQGTATNLKDVVGLDVDDGRAEVYVTGSVDGFEQSNSGYTQTQKPDDNTIVFSSYENPDSTLVNTRLKVVYTNTVKTGSIKVSKDKAYSTDEMNGTYTFAVTFSDVGDQNLENDKTITKTFSLRYGENYEITGIPVGTSYSIVETRSDTSSLAWVEEESDKAFTFNNSTKVVSGTITEDANEISLVFKNTLKPLINVNVVKQWKDSLGNELASGIPQSITVSLQRRQNGGGYEQVPDVENVILSESNSWAYSFVNLDEYVDYKAAELVKWEYRVVEIYDGQIIENNNLAGEYRVSYTHEDVDGGYTTTIVNTYIPKTSIKIIKSDATNADIKLADVAFKLEKLNNDMSVDNTFIPLTGVTDNLGILQFDNLSGGTYRLTETDTNENYILLSEPIIINIDRASGIVTVDGNEKILEGDTLVISVANTPKFILPATGGSGKNIILLAGIFIIWIACLTYRIHFILRRKKA